MNRRLLRYLVCGALVMLVALPARAQLVLNGGFETGTYSPQWALAPGGPFDHVCQAGATIGAATCIVHSGQYAMTFGLSGAQDSLSQTIPTVAGSTYTLSFWLANDNPLDQNTTTFAVFWDGNSVYSLPSPQPSFPYTEVVLNLTASTNSTPLTFVAQQDPSQWFLDDVSVVLLTPQADLAISKTDGVTSVNPGGTTTYTIVVSNAGPSAANGAVFTDPAVANLSVTSVTCGSASGGAACPTVPNTTVVLMQGAGIVIPTLPAGGSVTFSVNATIAAGATGTITNTANVAAPAGVTDPNLSNNSASDTDTVAAVANLALVKTDGSTTYTPGGTATYSITVTNSGPSNANSLTVIDNLPSGVTLTATVTCVAVGVATCGSISSAVDGTNLTATGATIAAGAGNRLVYSLPVRFADNLTTQQITNTATASDPEAAGVASGSDTNVLKITGAPAQPIPADDRRTLLLLTCLILLFAWRRARSTTLHRDPRR
jgi:uncharacterized repeat protein (TIGR01451 family)